MLRQSEVYGRCLDVVNLAARGISGSKLTAPEAADVLDFLDGLKRALELNGCQFSYVIYECARDAKRKNRAMDDPQPAAPVLKMAR